MRITDALKILQQASADAPPYRVILACGFTPLHLQSFLAAHLQQALPQRRVTVIPGLYDDTAGALEGADSSGADAVAVALEWPDLDPRLGFRSAGEWGSTALADVVSNARGALGRLTAAVERVAGGIPVAVCLPTLPLPPIFHTPGWQSADAELALEEMAMQAGARLARIRGCSVVSASRLAEESPAGSRFDLKSDLLTGLPYTVAHASAVGAALARLLAPPPPKKGLITDLDDTLWHGLVGEVGPDAVSWDVASHTQLHGLYQKLLAALAGEGVLVAVASKNDPAAVKQVFEREDLLLRSEQVFPLEVHWNAKSGSVSRILEKWNIAADSVVFVDDSPMEVAEVAAAHPGIEGVLFPKNDYAAGYAMLRRLRDLFGKPRISEEDGIRLDSIRKSSAFHEMPASGSGAEGFLQQAEAVIRFDFRLSAEDPRILELVNKTNQFNLNGVRRGEAAWRAGLLSPGALLAVVSYQDRFGPLGKIAVIQGRRAGRTMTIQTWVMSCRAFSRRIEHQCLKMLFDRYAPSEIVFEFAPTPKNGPLQDFFASILGARPAGTFALSRAQFDAACPPLYHKAIESHTSSKQWTTSQPV